MGAWLGGEEALGEMLMGRGLPSWLARGSGPGRAIAPWEGVCPPPAKSGSGIRWSRAADLPLPKTGEVFMGKAAYASPEGFGVMRPDVSSIPWRRLTPPAGKGIDHRTGGAVTPPEQERWMIP
jgi:hypothetical protein